jgi:flagellar basal-body rod protein FlgF
MLRGLYGAASGLLADAAWQNTLASDLSNLETPGFKAETPVLGAFGQELLSRTGADPGIAGRVSAGAAVVGEARQWGSGGLWVTGGALDVAPAPGTWLVVELGGVRYVTQDGALSLDARGELVTAGGARVLDAAGAPITVPPGSAPHILADGSVAAGGRTLARLMLVQVARPDRLEGVGGALFRPLAGSGLAPAAGAAAAVTPGALVASTVQEAQALTDLVEAGSAFQAGQEAFRTGSQTFTQLLGALQR